MKILDNDFQQLALGRYDNSGFCDDLDIIAYATNINDNIADDKYEDVLEVINKYRGRGQLAVIMGAIRGSIREELEPIELFGGVRKSNVFKMEKMHNTVYIADKLAIYDKENDTIIIPTDLWAVIQGKQQFAEVLRHICDESEQYRLMTQEEYRIMIEEESLKEISEFMSRYMRNKLDDYTDRLEFGKRKVNDLKTSLISTIKSNELLEKKIMAFEEDGSQEEELLKEIKAIKELESVKDIYILDSRLMVQTNPITSYVSGGGVSDDTAILIPEMNISINLSTGEILFIGDEQDKVQGFWRSVHPHINGMGEPCWGSVDATIAELIAQQEIFALVTVLINYLESVNAGDVAGASFTNWKRVDVETGEILPPIAQGRVNCAYCGNSTMEENTETCSVCGDVICADCPMIMDINEELVCQHCIDNQYIYCDTCGEYVHEDEAYWCEVCDTPHCGDCTTEIDGIWVCDDCVEQEELENDDEEENDDNYSNCSVCGTLVRNEDVYYHGEIPFCNDCFWTYVVADE